VHHRFAVLACLMVAVVCTPACSGSTNADDRELVPECATYLAAMKHCMAGASPDIAAQRAAATRQAFTVAAKDQAARDRLGAQCRAAQEQLSRACR